MVITPEMGELIIKGIVWGAQAAIAKGDVDTEVKLVNGFVDAGLTLEQMNTEMDGHVAKSREAADAALRAAEARRST